MIYVHAPFCESFCTYCGFYSVLVPGTKRNNDCVILSEAKNLCFGSYADAICNEIVSRRDEIASTSSVNTLYIGGGTPSVLPLDVLSRIVHSIQNEVRNLSDCDEFTIEGCLKSVQTLGGNISTTYQYYFANDFANPEFASINTAKPEYFLGEEG